MVAPALRSHPAATAGRVAVLLALALLCAVLAGCGGQQQGSSESDEPKETPKTTVSVLTTDRLNAPLSELEQLYASEHDDVAFTQVACASDKEMTAALKAGKREAKEAAAAQEESAASSEMPVSISLVMGMTCEDLSSKALKGAVDAKTPADVVADSLVLVTAKSGKPKAVTMRDVSRGMWTLRVAAQRTDLGALQLGALHNAGACTARGVYTGRLAKKNAVKVSKTAADLFQAVSQDAKCVAPVLKSDVYRFGGVKLVGEVPAANYQAPVYAGALTSFATDQESEKARAFMDWCTTDADAVRIWNKWGFTLAA